MPVSFFGFLVTPDLLGARMRSIVIPWKHDSSFAGIVHLPFFKRAEKDNLAFLKPGTFFIDEVWAKASAAIEYVDTTYEN